MNTPEYNKKYYLEHKEKRKKQLKISNKINYLYNRQKHKERNEKHNYKLSPQRKLGFLIKQKYKCAICKNQFNGDTYKPNIDHNHITKKIRGLLCKNCNFLLGFAKDDPWILKMAIQYLGERKKSAPRNRG